ncbi:unknown protein [Seminavis robusta]|uniref:Uncharacterized protein n=1 Tax=Seminavis robusta TaxID=568900 RepID=A0A9N8DR32_9STRA|nr:unknown protein [Seminavis robusta]|eukprot:Sro278_g106601.1  (123) ;mRNA; f:50985-51353
MAGATRQHHLTSKLQGEAVPRRLPDSEFCNNMTAGRAGTVPVEEETTSKFLGLFSRDEKLGGLLQGATFIGRCAEASSSSLAVLCSIMHLYADPTNNDYLLSQPTLPTTTICCRHPRPTGSS